MGIAVFGFFCSGTGKYFLIYVDNNGNPLAVTETVGNIYNALAAAGMPTIPSQC